LTRVTFINGDIEVAAELIAEGLGVSLAKMRGLMCAGAITSRCESGIGDDAGRHRLTFFCGARRFRLIVDGEGRVIRRSAVDFGNRPLPLALRRR
jgi:Family of unknown function (DUF6522)